MLDTAEAAQAVVFSLGKIFTFLFVTLGPLKLLGPFAKLTRGLGGAAKRQLALRSTFIALLAVLIAPTIGAEVLRKWGVSVGALLLTAGIVLFLVALKPVLEQYKARETAAPTSSDAATVAARTAPPSPLEFAFPAIVTPYGIAVLIVLVSLHSAIENRLAILGVAVGVLVLDLLAMLTADRILRTPLVPLILAILGAVMGVLQVALGVQAAVLGVHLLRLG